FRVTPAFFSRAGKEIGVGPLDRPSGNGFQIDTLTQSVVYAEADTLLGILQNGVVGTTIVGGTVAITVADEFRTHVDFKFVIWRVAETRSREHSPKIELVINLPIETANRKNNRI